jgi:hypothetical protein
VGVEACQGTPIEGRSGAKLPAHRRATAGALSVEHYSEPNYVYILFEGNIHSYRQIFMDGRKHSPDPNPTWYGESIGKYEGEALVMDTVGFNDKFWFDFAGHPHIEKLHIIERYRRPDLGHVEWETTIDDPGAYTKPFTLYGHSTLQTDTDLMEYTCQENNVDVSHILVKDSRNSLPKQ